MKICVVIGLIASLSTCLGYNIDTCNSEKKLQVDETHDTILTCSGITHDVMVWKLRHTNGTELHIGTCNKINGQCSGNNIYYTLTIDQGSSTSKLTVKQDHRNKIAGTLQCAGHVGGEVVNATTCDIRVVYTDYNVVNCSTSVSTTTDWTVSGSCQVDKIYASDGQYSCQWSLIPPTGAQRLFDGQRELVSFTEGGKSYHRMNCSFTGQPLPTGDGTYSYSLRIDPRESRAREHSGQFLVISSAKGPPVLQNCPDYVIDGDDVTCTCLASASDPPAVVTWTTVSHVVSQRLKLPLPKVSKALDGSNYSCNQYWGGLSSGHLKTTVYPMNVRYPPPSAPVISGVTNYTEGDSLQLTCTVTGGKPPVTNVTFSCGTRSDGKVTTSSSSGHEPETVSAITISSLTDKDHGSTCLCSATWKDRPSLYATTSTVTIVVQGLSGQNTQDTTSGAATTVDGQRSSTDSNDNKDDDDNGDDGGEAKLAAIVGGVAVVIIVALVIVIVILWKRRCDPLYAKTSARREDDDHTYVELNNHPQVMTPVHVTTQHENSTTQQETYENNSAGNERGNSTEPQYENTTANRLQSSPDRLYENTGENKQQQLSDVQYEIMGEPEPTLADPGYENTPKQ